MNDARRRIGFQAEQERQLANPVIFEDIADYVADAILRIRAKRGLWNADGSAQIAPNLLSLIIQETSMVVTIEKEDETDPRERRIGGVGIAIAHNVYKPTAPANQALNYIFVLDDRRHREESDAKDLLMLMRNRVEIEGYTGGLVNRPVYTNFRGEIS